MNIKLLLYIWNVSFNDYLSPFVELLKWIRDGSLVHSDIFGDKETNSEGDISPNIIYDYIESCYKGLQYPTSLSIEDNIQVYRNQQHMTYILFNGVDILWPFNSKEKLRTIKSNSSQPDD